jgi:hypothetical protein
VEAKFQGRPIEVRYRADLLDQGQHPALAGSYIRERVILLDPELKRDPEEHERILLHELFHFVWVRLGNGRRFEWERLLRAEIATRARGEAGWSAEWRKGELSLGDVSRRSRKWREYCCEAFCDTGALVWGAVSKEVTLGSKRLALRFQWFRKVLGEEALPI